MIKLHLTLLLLSVVAVAPAQANDDLLPPPKTATASTSIKVSDQDALEDDILAVINLPLAAADAREAGIAEDDLKEVLDTIAEVGLSAGEASEALAEEAEVTRTRGVKRGFGLWVKLQIAEGLRGKQLAAKIKARKDDLANLSDEQRKALALKLEAQRAKFVARRQRLQERRDELTAKGKAKLLLFKDRHEKLAAKGRRPNGPAPGEFNARITSLEDRIAAGESGLEAEKKRLEDMRAAAAKAAAAKREEVLEARREGNKGEGNKGEGNKGEGKAPGKAPGKALKDKDKPGGAEAR